ncbi:MAG: hypothetical protein ACC742_13825 [Thermoanaerobaculales bacterium]
MKLGRRLSLLVLVVLVLSAFVPAMLAPGVAEAENSENGWMAYIPNHPDACALLPYDCYVIYIRPAP